jgi:hypothetical protein
MRGGYKSGRILSYDEICNMSFGEHRRSDREEAAYAAGRAAERAGRSAAAILRLQAAALAEESPDTTEILQLMKDEIRARQVQVRDQEIEQEMPEEEHSVGFAA